MSVDPEPLAAGQAGVPGEAGPHAEDDQLE